MLPLQNHVRFLTNTATRITSRLPEKQMGEVISRTHPRGHAGLSPSNVVRSYSGSTKSISHTIGKETNSSTSARPSPLSPAEAKAFREGFEEGCKYSGQKDKQQDSTEHLAAVAVLTYVVGTAGLAVWELTKKALRRATQVSEESAEEI